MGSRVVTLFLLTTLLTWIGQIVAAGNTSETEAAAMQWLALIDSGNYIEGWDQTTPLFQATSPHEQWVSTMQSMRSQLGSNKSRSAKTSVLTKTLTGASQGEHVVIQFRADFANKRDATETVTLMKDNDGTWKVSGYFLK